MNNSFDRLSALFEKLGISVSADSDDRGELLAYCAGIERIQLEFENYFNQLFADTATGSGLSLLCELLGIDSALSDKDKREQLVKKLSMQYGSYSYGEFEKVFDKQCPMLTAAPFDFYITINGSVKNDYDPLAKLGRIFEDYLPPCTVIGFSGNGLDFDYWDSTPYLFKDYDNFNLNFEFLDELE